MLLAASAASLKAKLEFLASLLSEAAQGTLLQIAPQESHI